MSTGPRTVSTVDMAAPLFSKRRSGRRIVSASAVDTSIVRRAARHVDVVLHTKGCDALFAGTTTPALSARNHRECSPETRLANHVGPRVRQAPVTQRHHE